MFSSYNSIRHSYQLLYIKILLSSFSFSRLNKSSFLNLNERSVSNVRVIRKNNVFSSFSKKILNNKTKKSLHLSILKNLNVSPSLIPYLKQNRYFILPFINLFITGISNPSNLLRFTLKKNIPLRLSNLFLFSSVFSNFNCLTSFAFNSLFKTYSSFFFLFSSSIYNELYLTHLLKFLFLKYDLRLDLKKNSLLLNRLMLNSLFFISNSKNKVRLLSRSFDKKKKKRGGLLGLRPFKRAAKQKSSFFFKIKRLMYILFYQLNKEESNVVFSHTNFFDYESQQKRAYSLSKINKRSFSFFLDNYPIINKLKLYKSSKLSSSFAFNQLSMFEYQSDLLYNFTENVCRFFLKSNLLVPLKYKSGFYLNFLSSPANMSNSFIFSFYKKQRNSQLFSFLKRLRILNSKTYNLFINGTGSNYHSTFLRRNRVLFSKWSGLFGFKKRLKYRKGVAHKISYFFHRFISRLYKARRIKRLNININGFYKFAEIFLDAFARQIEYSADYALNLPRPGQEALFFSRIPLVQSSFYGSKSSVSLPRSIVKSLLFPLVSSSFFVRLNLNELRYVLPELSSFDLSKLHFLISNDNKVRSSLLFRWARFHFYKNKNLRRSRLVAKKRKVNLNSFIKHKRLLNLRRKKVSNSSGKKWKRTFDLQKWTQRPSNFYSQDRSLLVNRLIGIFMARYNITSKKDFYVAVSYLNKYKSTILNYPHIDSSDFISAYSIIYLLKILKQNIQYVTRFQLYSRLLRKRFIRYLKGVSRLKLKISGVVSRRRVRRFLLSKFSKKTKIRVGSSFIKKSKFYKNKLKRLRLIKQSILKFNFNRKDLSVLELFNLFCIKLFRFKSNRKIVLAFINSSNKNPNEACKQIIFRLFKSFLFNSILGFKRNKRSSSKISLKKISNFKRLDFKRLKRLIARGKKLPNVSFVPLNVKIKKQQRRLFSYINLSKILKMYVRLPFFSKLIKKSSKKVINGKHLKYLLSYKDIVSKFNLLLDSNLESFVKSDRFRFSSKQEQNEFYRKRVRSFVSKRKDLNRKRKYKFYKFRKRLNRKYKFQNNKFQFNKNKHRNKRFSIYTPFRKSRLDRVWKLSGVCRLIRTRMRKFIQVLYSVGYVKCRASLSHGGCVARKRYYDKRYLF